MYGWMGCQGEGREGTRQIREGKRHRVAPLSEGILEEYPLSLGERLKVLSVVDIHHLGSCIYAGRSMSVRLIMARLARSGDIEALPCVHVYLSAGICTYTHTSLTHFVPGADRDRENWGLEVWSSSAPRCSYLCLLGIRVKIRPVWARSRSLTSTRPPIFLLLAR